MATIAQLIRIDAPQASVYDALSTIHGIKGWLTADAEEGTRETDTALLRFSDGTVFVWKFAETKPSSLVRWRCVEGPGSAAGTTVDFQLTMGNDGKTRLAVDHDGLADDPDLILTCNMLWGAAIYHLKQYVETKQTRLCIQLSECIN